MTIEPTVSDAEVEAVAVELLKARPLHFQDYAQAFNPNKPSDKTLADVRTVLLAAARVRAIPETEAVMVATVHHDHVDRLLSGEYPSEQATLFREVPFPELARHFVPLYAHSVLPDTKEGLLLDFVKECRKQIATIIEDGTPTDWPAWLLAADKVLALAASPAQGSGRTVLVNGERRDVAEFDR